MKSWVARSGRKMGGLKFAKNSLNRLLRDPVYAGKVKYKDQLYPAVHKAIIDEELFNSVQVMLDANNITKTGYRQDDNQCLLKGLTHCAVCHSAMTPSFSLSKGKKYYYYRCTTDLDGSKDKCRISSINAKQLENLVVEELKFLAEDPRIIEGVVESATKEQKGKVKELLAKKKIVQDNLVKVDKKAKNLLEIIAGDGKKAQTGYILKEIEDLDEQAKQLKKEIDFMDFEINNQESKIVSTDLIRENFKVFRDVFDQLTQDEKYDLLHLLIKKITYFEDPEETEKGTKTGKIKMDLWELPPIDPSKINSSKPVNNGFDESHAWLPWRDAQQNFFTYSFRFSGIKSLIFQEVGVVNDISPFSQRVSRNPVTLAREWLEIMQENNLTRASLARRLGTSRARVTQVVALLKLSPVALEKIVSIGDPMVLPLFTERRLRSVVKLSEKEQELIIDKIFAFSRDRFKYDEAYNRLHRLI